MLSFGVRTPDFARTKNLLAHIPGAAEKAMSRAINKAVTSAKTEAIKRVRERYTVADYTLRDVHSIKILRSSPKRLNATLIATSPLLRIAKFKVKPGRTLVTEIKHGQPKTWPHGFFARMTGPKGGDHYGVFAREKEWSIPTKGAYSNKIKKQQARRGEDRSPVGQKIRRQRLFEGFTVSIAEMVGHHEILEMVLTLAEEKLSTELDRQVQLFLQGKVS